MLLLSKRNDEIMNYKILYYNMFNRITDLITILEKTEFNNTDDCYSYVTNALKKIQLNAEIEYMINIDGGE